MKVVVDDKIPYIKGVLEPYAEVVYAPGAQIDAPLVADADAIITRTRTECNESLLSGSTVKFIASATIGYDHIDTVYCENNGIVWTNAPGCNSGSVMQYIASVFAALVKAGVDMKHAKVGIVGVGNVGSKVEGLCRALGIETILCDPPRFDVEGGDFVSFQTVLLEADIVTFHVPLEKNGKYPTFHMLNEAVFKNMKKKIAIINTSRGGVVDNMALKKGLSEKKIAFAVLDVWESEPEIDTELLNDVFIGTPHIAGYSADGKANGTAMSIHALSRFFNIPLVKWQPDSVSDAENQFFEISNDDFWSLFLHTYSIHIDSDKLKYNPEKFEHYRGHYPVRREFQWYNVKLKNCSPGTSDTLKQLGFNLL